MRATRLAVDSRNRPGYVSVYVDNGERAATARRLVGVTAALSAAVGVLVGSVLFPSAARAAPIQISTQPSLLPGGFRPSTPDYVVRCQPANEVQVSVSAPPDTTVSVDDAQWQTGSFTQVVNLSAGQSFDIRARHGDATVSTYVIRCLPSDFPAFTATRAGNTQAQWYVVTPGSGGSPPPEISRNYVAFFDRNGVPMWWMRADAGITRPTDAKLLPNGNVAWMRYPFAGMQERRLDGSLVRTLNTVGSGRPSARAPGGPGADIHDIQVLPNGNYVLGRYFTRSGVDMSSCGGSTSRDLVDFELQVLTPGGNLRWSWRASDHIPFSEVTARWTNFCTSGDGDIYHWNSVAPVRDGYVLSFRHLDAVYRIDRATGAIDWKLGGEHRAESLAVVGDQNDPPFSGQHDARVLGDGSVTVHDNETGRGAPRAVRYAIDETANTATLLEDVRLAEARSSWCCGSARGLPGGNWVSAWGANPYITEQTATGARVFKLSFANGLFSYRANPVLPGKVSREALRAGMDAQYPRP